MTQNNTLNKVHVAATELPQLLSQNTNIETRMERGNCCAPLKLTAKKLDGMR